MSSETFLRRPQVEDRVGLKRAAIYRAIQQGTFPAPIRISTRAVAWRESDIAAWQAAKVAASLDAT